MEKTWGLHATFSSFIFKCRRIPLEIITLNLGVYFENRLHYKHFYYVHRPMFDAKCNQFILLNNTWVSTMTAILIKLLEIDSSPFCWEKSFIREDGNIYWTMAHYLLNQVCKNSLKNCNISIET